MKWYGDTTPQPRELIGPSLIVVSIVDTMLALGKAPLIAGDMMLLHSCSVKIQTGTGYFNLVIMLVCSAVHASLGEGFPHLTLLPHSKAFCFNTLIAFCLFSSGTRQIANISAVWSHLNFSGISIYCQSQ